MPLKPYFKGFYSGISKIGCIHSLDWTTGLSYFPFLDKCLCLFLERSLHVATPFTINKYLATMNDCNNNK